VVVLIKNILKSFLKVFSIDFKFFKTVIYYFFY